MMTDNASFMQAQERAADLLTPETRNLSTQTSEVRNDDDDEHAGIGSAR